MCLHRQVKHKAHTVRGHGRCACRVRPKEASIDPGVYYLAGEVGVEGIPFSIQRQAERCRAGKGPARMSGRADQPPPRAAAATPLVCRAVAFRQAALLSMPWPYQLPTYATAALLLLLCMQNTPNMWHVYPWDAPDITSHTAIAQAQVGCPHLQGAFRPVSQGLVS